ncbi:GNAT family N-acetyltransferase [Chromobacterium subtsugae]|uniref:GNAT family N-acetyltransferase n=1 Tax=Chromobacterium subtsugae TaxID=251747 RepID=UPI00069AFC2E|nr:GNAT family N-acetyltransferase [Chromobacterium subtsugae]
MRTSICPLQKYHKRKEFDCGNELLNDWYKKTARQKEESYQTRTFVLVNVQYPDQTLGFYCLFSGQADISLYPNPGKVKGIVPIVKIGRFAVDKRYKRQKLGEKMLAHALKKALDASKTLGIHMVCVDAKDEEARAFYEHYGFSALPGSLIMCMSMKDIEAAFGAA